ncbi:hypothetical protein BDM02DRAFT_3185961 [Thelephora ganbajun]|uniref:Uncharacterized protein n=1 Tax=Thelephora ganbajun TaxID=370292 RepID=A0ACB6ZKG2_THEGA|nr:hypothetical protein BDM02DRAFT_3185961 [Thelephora ganbajun]
MHLPKYSNPHLVTNTTRIVSRKALQLQGDADDDVERDGEAYEVGLDEQEVEDLHAKLDKIVSKRLKLKRALESSHETHSNKKRRTLAEGEGRLVDPQQHSEPVSEFTSSRSLQTNHQLPLQAFRLISKSLPPRAIHLTPKPFKVIPVKEPPCEDTEQEFKGRVYRSALSAVDLEQIKHTFSMAGDRKPPRLLKTISRSQTTAAPLLLLEISPAAPLPAPWINPRSRVPPKASPHQLPVNGACCPVIQTNPPHCPGRHKKKGGRGRGKAKNKNKLFP